MSDFPAENPVEAPAQQELDLKIRLPVFEGPLDLLLYLIRKEEVDIYQIPIERITHQYLEYLRLMRMLDLDVAGEYLVMAATLLYIKSRQLLPKDQQVADQEEEEDDPRWELIRQLVEYKKFKDVANQLGTQASLQDAIFRGHFDPKGLPALPAGGKIEVGIFDLISAFQKILSHATPELQMNVLEDRFTVSDKIIHVQQLLEQRARVLFRDLFPEDAGRTEIVVTFLALLELIRLHQIRAEQEEVFGEIQLVKAEAL